MGHIIVQGLKYFSPLENEVFHIETVKKKLVLYKTHKTMLSLKEICDAFKGDLQRNYQAHFNRFNCQGKTLRTTMWMRM